MRYSLGYTEIQERKAQAKQWENMGVYGVFFLLSLVVLWSALQPML